MLDKQSKQAKASKAKQKQAKQKQAKQKQAKQKLLFYWNISKFTQNLNKVF